MLLVGEPHLTQIRQTNTDGLSTKIRERFTNRASYFSGPFFRVVF